MFLVPGVLVTLLTFPGVIVHEAAHQLFCRWLRVAVLDVRYLRLGNPSGFVIHEVPPTALKHLLIAVGPVMVNTVVGALVALPAVFPVIYLGAGTPLHALLLWLGISIAMHAFPSTTDAKAVWASLKSPRTPLSLKLTAMPVVGLIYLGALGSRIWLDVVYAFFAINVIPSVMLAVAH
jgi:hypothetical protein